MTDSGLPRPTFIDRVLTSSFPGQVAKRFLFPDGEVGAVYTLSRKAPAGVTQPVILVIATFSPTQPRPGVHDFGIDYAEQAVVSTDEARDLLAHFDYAQAALFRVACRAARA